MNGGRKCRRLNLVDTKKNRASSRGEGGFTLVELLICLVCLGFIQLIISESFRIAAKASQDALIAGDGSPRLTEITLRRLLQSDAVRTGRFQGDEWSISFDADPPPGAMYVEPFRYSFGMSDPSPLKNLVLNWSGSERTNSVVNGRTTLAEDLSQLSLSYFSSESGWQAAWPPQATVPSLIRVRYAVARRPARLTADFLIALPGHAQAECLTVPCLPAKESRRL